MLTSRIEIIHQSGEKKSLEPEDIFASAADQLFPDNLRVFHGDGSSRVRYSSATFGPLELSVTDPVNEQERSKFAHAVWNASILLCEMIGCSAATLSGETGEEEEGVVVLKEEEEAIMSEEEEAKTSINLRKAVHEKCKMLGERVLELGAGTGLGGIASALAGAKEVTITDYPLPQILQNISANVSANVPENIRAQVTVIGHEWGKLEDKFAEQHAQHFSCVIAADTLWLRSQHSNLCHSISHFLAYSSDAKAIIVAGFHTGREIVASFFDEIILSSLNLTIGEVWETDIENRTRPWMGGDFAEPFGERSKWHVVAVLKRRSM